MSAAAIPIYNALIAKGVSEKEARETAEVAAAKVLEIHKNEIARIAQTVAEAEIGKAIARLREIAENQFVSKGEYHKRDRDLITREEVQAEFTRLRESRRG